jgi:hypothetical protein
LDIRGEGRGVTSGIALNIGEEKAELGADAMIDAAMLFIEGVRVGMTPMLLLDLAVLSPSLRALLECGSVDGVREAEPTSVCTRNPALMGVRIGVFAS